MSATPILDGQQPLPEGKKKRRWLPRLVGLIIGVLFLWWTETGAPADTVSSMTLLFPLAVILAIYVAILVNLLGHLIAGMAAGFEIRSLALVGFFVDKQATRWRLRFVPRRIFSRIPAYDARVYGESGATLCLVYGGRSGGHDRSASLHVVGIAEGRVRRGSFLRKPGHGRPHCFIPYTSRGISSPAKRLMILAGKGVEAERLAAIMYLMAIDAQGTRPSAWPRELLEKIGVPGKATPFSATSLALTYMVVRDSNDPEAIADALEKALALIDEMPPDTRRWVLASAACFHASFRNQPSVAEEWLESARKVKRTVLSEKDWDSEAVGLIALAKGDAEASKESLTRYLAYVDQRPQPLCGMLVAQRARTMILLRTGRVR